MRISSGGIRERRELEVNIEVISQAEDPEWVDHDGRLFVEQVLWG